MAKIQLIPMIFAASLLHSFTASQLPKFSFPSVVVFSEICIQTAGRRPLSSFFLPFYKKPFYSKPALQQAGPTASRPYSKPALQQAGPTASRPYSKPALQQDALQPVGALPEAKRDFHKISVPKTISKVSKRAAKRYKW